MLERITLILACLALGGCATRTGNASVPRTAPAAVAGDLLNSISPVADHHKHLMGPAIAEIASGQPLLSAVQIPAEFAGLLREREAAAKDKERLARLYTSNATALTDQRHGWITGSATVAEFMTVRFGRPYSLVPVHFSRQRNSAQIAGYYTRGEGAERQYLGYFHLALTRESTGRWKIASETPKIPITAAMSVKTAKQLIEEMDAAGLRRAVVLSEAFWADGPLIPVADAYRRVVAENDWTAAQARQFPDRLIAFCSFNPVADHALRELDRCAASGAFRGLKFSFAMSAVDLKNSDHVARLRTVFAKANAHRLPIVVHLRGGPDYGAEHVQIFVREVLPAATDVVVQIAHLWGGEAYSGSALTAFAEALTGNREATGNLYFDISEITAPISQTSSPATQRELADAIRRIGVDRILFGSDGEDMRRSWRLLLAFLPLTETEFRSLARNVASYLRTH